MCASNNPLDHRWRSRTSASARIASARVTTRGSAVESDHSRVAWTTSQYRDQNESGQRHHP